jgi:hypothetical protein
MAERAGTSIFKIWAHCKGGEWGQLSPNQNESGGTPKAFGAVRRQATKIE